MTLGALCERHQRIQNEDGRGWTAVVVPRTALGGPIENANSLRRFSDSVYNICHELQSSFRSDGPYHIVIVLHPRTIVSGLRHKEWFVVSVRALHHGIPKSLQRAVMPLGIEALTDNVVVDVRSLQMIEEPFGRRPIRALVDMNHDSGRRASGGGLHTSNAGLQNPRQMIPLPGLIVQVRGDYTEQNLESEPVPRAIMFPS